MPLLFGHIFNLVLKTLFWVQCCHNVCSVASLCSYRQQSEHMGKQAFNVTNVSSVSGVKRQ